MTSIEAGAVLEAKLNGTITDFKYSPTGQYLAVADSEGLVQVYSRKDAKTYSKSSEFKADEGSIWSISWADARYGNIIGIGSFKNKVAIFQEAAGGWREIAYHDLHKASVNWVQFSPYGLKLYAGSSDGYVSILELSHKNWRSTSFKASKSLVACFALQPLPLGEHVPDENLQKIYPRIATVSKDHKIKVWAHENERLYNEQPQQKTDNKSKKADDSGYSVIREVLTPKQTIKSLIWQPHWGSLAESLSQITLITCTEEGAVKELSISPTAGEDTTKAIYQGENPVTKLSQSLTGNMIVFSVADKLSHKTYVYERLDEQWRPVKKGKADFLQL